MTEAIIKGLGLGLILALSVGPVIFTIIKQSINNGAPGGFSFVAGVWFSDIVLVLMSNFFSELVHQLLVYQHAIAISGGLFLLGLGVYNIFFKKVFMQANQEEQGQTLSQGAFYRIALSGFIINTLNPSVLIFWLINATAFSTHHGFWQRMIIFTVCLSVNMIADVLKILLAGRIRNNLRAQHIQMINRISGAILLILGLLLMYGNV